MHGVALDVPGPAGPALVFNCIMGIGIIGGAVWIWNFQSVQGVKEFLLLACGATAKML